MRDRVVNSVLYLMDLRKDFRDGNFGENSRNNLAKSCLGAKVRRIKRGTKNLVAKSFEIGEAQGKQGIESLIDMAIEKLEAKKGSSTGGGDKGGSSGIGESGSSLYLTGVSDAGEYLVGKEELQKEMQKSNGEVLIALKEKNSTDERISLTIGGKEGKKTNDSPQLQIKKEDIQDGRVSIELRKFDISKK